jgi:hypothetical protein
MEILLHMHDVDRLKRFTLLGAPSSKSAQMAEVIRSRILIA